MSDIKAKLNEAVSSGALLESSRKNILQILEHSSSNRVVTDSIAALVDGQEWQELNDRFFRTLAFGTGGLRGRTIGRIVTEAERGTPTELGRPEFPCVGTNAVNYFNISRATQGLVAYLKEWLSRTNQKGRPKIAIAHDSRHFSRDFAELAARVCAELGCDAVLFEGPRSTPELSFAVRVTGSHAGIVLTASHNPPHDNGFKCYFSDGAQVVEPHASGIIEKVNAIVSENYQPVAEEKRGTIETAGRELDDAYMNRLETLVLDPELVASQRDLKIVYSSLHGAGGVIICPMLERLGFPFTTVAAQDVMDGRFPTVKSPNPENAEALTMAIEQAKSEGADLVIATDPDCDRMGVAVRDNDGTMSLLTGNMIGSVLAYYRVRKLFEQGVLTRENASRAVIIKTFVTSDLQKAIANRNGLRCVETLTGFKYIGEKLGKYQNALPEDDRAGYVERPESETRALRLAKSMFYVFGGEESYGYSGSDFVRDKDGNGAAVMFAEVAAYAKSRGLTLTALLDEVYCEYGYYFEKNGSLEFEGAEGAAKIQKLIESYASKPPTEIDGGAVQSIRNFATESFEDVEGDPIPREKMLMFELADGRRVAVRPSGTEPKIKFYMFAKKEPDPGRSLPPEDLPEIKSRIRGAIDSLWEFLQKDARTRAEG